VVELPDPVDEPLPELLVVEPLLVEPLVPVLPEVLPVLVVLPP